MTRALLEQALEAIDLLQHIRNHPRRHDLDRDWLTQADRVTDYWGGQSTAKAIRAELAKPQSEPESFEVWRENPYTIALVKSVEEDYHPAHTEAEVQEIMDRFIQREVGAVPLSAAEETVRRILGVSKP